MSELPDAIELSFDVTALPPDARKEPHAIAATAGVAAATAEVPAEPAHLDPTRLALPRELGPRRRREWQAPLASLLAHLLPLLALIDWTRQPPDVPRTVPIQLVIEQPPPEPPPAPVPAEPKPQAPPPGLLASDDFGAVGSEKSAKNPTDEHPAEEKPPSPGNEAAAATAEPSTTAEQSDEAAKPTRTAALVAPPRLESLPSISLPAPSELPPPVPLRQAAPKHAPTERPTIRKGLTLPLPLYADSASATAASARYPGPSASRDEYCAYALSLVLKHLDLLPQATVGARRGQTTLKIRVRDDGTIIGAMVASSSGYSDIDDRIVQMVNAVGKFPRLPMWVPGPTADFILRLHFPHTAAH